MGRLKPTAVLKRKIQSWKPRIYKKFRTMREFIQPLGINEKRFTHWIHGRNMPSVDLYEKIESELEKLGV